MFQPVIKWSGSKRSQADEIVSYIPNSIDTYYESFCGGCSVLRALLDSTVKVKQYICNDLNKDLIDLWKVIMTNPKGLSEYYEWRWNELNQDDDKDRKREYFNLVRQQYNEKHSPMDFMFIMRTTTNGMPRYNSNGEFNNSFHITRNGITPDKLEKIISEWSLLLNSHDVHFINKSFEEIHPSENDFMYLDPPYANTKGMYFGGFDNTKLWEYLRSVPCHYVLSYDGISGSVDNTYIVPNDLYTRHEYILSGNSSFKRVIGKSKDSVVYESLYIR